MGEDGSVYWSNIIDLLESFALSLPSSHAALPTIRDYVEWQMHQRAGDFVPSDDDDVDLRNYLLFLHTNGADRAALKKRVAALKQFYQWAKTERIIVHTPFDDYTFDYPFLTSEQTRPRQQTLPSDMYEREVERLRALGQIAEQLNSSVDTQSALDNTLRTLLKVMDLQTGWVSMLTKPNISVFPAGDSPPHGFGLAAAQGLPPGLEQDDRRNLCQPPACHCQQLLIEGRLTRAVNIVECTRLRDSARAAGDNQGLLFHASMPLISQGKPLGLINVANTNWQFLTAADLHFLSAVGAQVGIALERANLYEIAEAQRARFEHELQVAHDVQASLMPRKMPEIPGFGLAATWRPALEVGGDFYDIFPLQYGRWGIVIGDVMGKGAPAALYMAMAHSLILSSALRHQSPAAVITEVNQTIFAQCSSQMFVTVFLGVLDPKKHTLQYVNAGQNPPIVRRASGKIESLTNTGGLVGLFDNLQFSEATLKLRHGDVVVGFTDGVTEEQNSNGEIYGIDRLTSAVAAAPREASELLGWIEGDFNAFVEGVPRSDDITLFVLSRD